MKKLVRVLYQDEGRTLEAWYSAPAEGGFDGPAKLTNVVRVEFYRATSNLDRPYHVLDAIGDSQSKAILKEGRLELELRLIAWVTSTGPHFPRTLRFYLRGLCTASGELRFENYASAYDLPGDGSLNTISAANYVNHFKRQPALDREFFGTEAAAEAQLDSELYVAVRNASPQVGDPNDNEYLLVFICSVVKDRSLWVDTMTGRFGTVVRENESPWLGPRAEWIQTHDSVHKCPATEAAVSFRPWLLRVCKLAPTSTIALWNALAKSYLDALEIVEGASDMSFVPTISGETGSWTLALLAQPISAGSDSHLAYTVRSLAPSGNAKATFAYPNLPNRDDDQKILSYPGDVSIHEQNPYSRVGPILDVDVRILASAGDDHWLRVGALDLALPPVQSPDGKWTLTMHAAPIALHKRTKRMRDPSPIVTELSLRCEKLWIVDPHGGAEDSLPDSLRSRYVDRSSSEPVEKDIARQLQESSSLVFRLDAGNATSRAILEVNESSAANRTRGFVLRMNRDPKAAMQGAREFPGSILVYLSREPFLLGLVEVAPLTTLGPDHDEIGNRSLSEIEGNRWEFAAAGTGFALRLPPQAIGEEMEKSLEQPIDGRDRPVDFRLGLPARLDLRSSYFRQRSAEAPWNLRRVLGYPGQRAPGALVQNLRFELVYGLATELDARGVPTRLHVAELGSRMGALSGPVDRNWAEGKGYEEKDIRRSVLLKYRQGWARALACYRSRLAVLELYAPGEVVEQSAAMPPVATGTLTLDRGLTFSLRRTAHLHYPISPSRSIGSTLKLEPPHDAAGLKGGVTWPFESEGVYRNLWREPKTTAGQISKVFFSSLGGYGHQRAAFDNRRTLITSSTVMGRLQRLTVERVGRIGVLWNRAKHVIVYQRTTLASEQFVADQFAHAGRALLRKVEEYIEILQRQRDYPEFEQTKLPRGCVEGSSFVSWRIPVDGRWGRDIEGGIEIPLWQVDADPRIYPKPVINIVQSGDKKEIAARVATAVATPERLYFYSSLDPLLDDRTDLWPAMAGVDFVDEPRPEPELDDPLDASDPDGLLPDSSLDAVGWERTTWILEAPTHPTNVVTERAESAMNARIHSVTMMRATTPTGDESPTLRGLQAAASVRTSLTQSRADLLKVVSAANEVTDELRSQVRREIDRTRARIGKVANAAQTAKAEFEARKGDLGEWFNKRCDQAKELVDSRVRASVATATRLTTEWKNQVIAGIGEIKTTEIVEKATAHAYVERWIAEARVLVRPLSWGLEDVRDTLGLLRDQLEQKRSELRENFDRWVEPIEVGYLLPEEGDAIAQAIAGALNIWLNSLTSSLPQTVPAHARGAIHQIRDKVTSAIAVEISAALRNLRTNLTPGSEPYLPPLGSEVELARTAIFGELDVPLRDATGLAWIVVALDEVISSIDTAADAITPPVVSDGLEELRETLREAIENFQTPISPEMLRTTFEGAVTVLENDIAGVAANLTATIGNVHDLVCDQGPLAWLKKLEDLIPDWKFDDLAPDLERELKNFAGSTVEELYDVLNKTLSDAVNTATDLYAGTRTALKDLGKSPTFQDPKETLRLIRAVGEGPLLPEMTFNRKRMAYFFDDYAAAVRTSPVAALVNRVGDDLKALGLRVPTKELLDRIIPDGLQNFDLGKILPDFAALKNNQLFRRIKLPAIANDRIQVRHGLDKATQSGWLKAKVDVPLSGRADVFSCGPLNLRLLKADFRARSEMTVTIGQGMQKLTDGEIQGDWQLAFGGAPIVTFARTLLHFNASGRMHFDIRAENIQMDRALKWIADLVRKVGSGEDGFALELMQHNGAPIGVRCSLLLPLPPISGGAFSMSGLTLGASLMLCVDPDTREFTISAAFNLGEKSQPFTLTISFLGGGGWLESRAMYVPSSGSLSTDVSIGMVAGAGAAFAFGPARGSVYLQFGIFIEFHSKSNRGSSLSIGIMLLVRGNVVLCGFIDIGLMLLLQAIYQDTGTLTAYGTLSVTIKISRFFKIRVRQQVKYKLAGKGGAAARGAASSAPTTRYLALAGTDVAPVAVRGRQSSAAGFILKMNSSEDRCFQ